MRIGLYSLLARQSAQFGVSDIIQERKEKKIRDSREEMIRFRDQLITRMRSTGETPKIFDFFTLSEFRDLFFHRQEKMLTIPEIESFLYENELEFCGFALDQTQRIKFDQAVLGEGDWFDLNKWAEFEEDHPETFIGMYQFWCKKL